MPPEADARRYLHIDSHGTPLLGISSDYSHRGGFAMPPTDKFYWYTIGAALLAILVVVIVVALFQ